MSEIDKFIEIYLPKGTQADALNEWQRAILAFAEAVKKDIAPFRMDIDEIKYIEHVGTKGFPLYPPQPYIGDDPKTQPRITS